MTSKRTVYVEATALLREKKTGVDYYAQGLIGTLARLMPDTQFVCFAFEDIGTELSVKGKNISLLVIRRGPSKLHRLRMLLGLAQPLEDLLGVNSVNDVIFPNFYSWPVRTKSARVYPVVYDTTYIDTPEYVDRRNRILLKRLVKQTMKNASKIITISQSSKKSLRAHYGRSDADYHIVYPAPAELPAVSGFRPKFSVPNNYLLFVGTLEPRKNVENLILAHLALPADIREKYPLVLAGGKGWKDEKILRLIEENSENFVEYLGYISDKDKAWLYKNAYAFVYPAKFEGFGMPVVEALKMGAPTITSRNSSLPEAGGDAVMYCDGSIEGITEAMLACIKDKDRNERIVRGREYAARFSWTKSANIVKTILEEGAKN